MGFLLLNQTLVVSRDIHCQILFRLHKELHPCFALLQEGLLLQKAGLKFAAKNPRGTTVISTILSSDNFLLQNDAIKVKVTLLLHT